jgi:putative NADPH-quinone reductase
MQALQRKILLLFAHPSLDRSEVNVELMRASKNIEGVTLVDLYAEYPTYLIDIDREQQRLIEHDVIVFMFPLYWYSTPALLKEWQDLVLEYGFAYGSEGNALNGKLFLCALTAGGAESAYRAEGYNHYTIRELIRPLEQTAALCGMQFLPPFALLGARTAVEEGRLQQHVDDWRRVLEALRTGQLDLERAGNLPRLNDNLTDLIGAAS